MILFLILLFGLLISFERDCIICLCPFDQECPEEFMKTHCFHYFHRFCLGKNSFSRTRCRIFFLYLKNNYKSIIEILIHILYFRFLPHLSLYPLYYSHYSFSLSITNVIIYCCSDYCYSSIIHSELFSFLFLFFYSNTSSMVLPERGTTEARTRGFEKKRSPSPTERTAITLSIM